MSFREKSNWVLLLLTSVIYGAYFTTTIRGALANGIAVTADNARLFGAVFLMVVLTIAAHILMAIVFRQDADEVDERDRVIELRGDQRGGLLTAVGLFSVLGLALTGASVFWLAHAALGALVAAEIVKAVSKLIDYRRGV